MRSRFLGFRKLREVCRIHFHQFSSKSHGVVTSYDQKNKKVNDKKSNDYFNVSVIKVDGLSKKTLLQDLQAGKDTEAVGDTPVGQNFPKIVKIGPRDKDLCGKD